MHGIATEETAMRLAISTGVLIALVSLVAAMRDVPAPRAAHSHSIVLASLRSLHFVFPR